MQYTRARYLFENWYFDNKQTLMSNRLSNSGSRRSFRPGRLQVFQIFVVVIFIILAGRLYQLQFIVNEQFIAQADENRFGQVSIPATRGIITDRNGVELAINTASANVTVTPALLPADADEETAVLRRLASLVGIPYSGELNTVDERGIPEQSLLTMVRTGEGIAPFRPVIVETDVDYDIARLIIAEQNSLPGIDVEWVSVREYPTGALTSHVIGYMGPIPESLADEYEERGYVLDRDRIGYDGMEFALEDALAGQPGIQDVERDVAGEVVRVVGERPPQAGYNVQLTIDVELQERAQELIIETLDNMRRIYSTDEIGFDQAVVIATNPRTGEILAMVSYPNYDNSRFARNIDYPYYLQVSQDPKRPLFNQAISSLYPPGSIFKMITLTGVLEEGVMEPEDTIFDPGAIQLENRYYANDPAQSQEFVCWLNDDRGGHGEVNAILALAYSCDMYFYKTGGGYPGEVEGNGLGIANLSKWMDIFGLGNYTGIELAGEIDGVLPTPEWKRRTWGENWSTGDTYNSAFGQGYVLSTPLQMINMMNTFANDGIMTRPTLIREITDQNGNVVQAFEPDVVGDLTGGYRNDPFTGEPAVTFQPVSNEDIRIVQEGMRGAVTIEREDNPRLNGTAIGAQERVPYVPVAGKTGTAEYCDNIAAALERCIPGAWPAHAWYMGYAPYGNPEIAVLTFIYNGQEGSAVALPVSAAMMDTYFQLKSERAREQQLEEEEANPQPTQDPNQPPPTPTFPPLPTSQPIDQDLPPTIPAIQEAGG